MLLAQVAIEGGVLQWLGGEVRGITQSLTWWGQPTVIDLMEAKGITIYEQDGQSWLRIPLETQMTNQGKAYWILLTGKE